MSGTSGSVALKSNPLALPAPKIRMLVVPLQSFVSYVLSDGNKMDSRHEVRVNLVGLPSAAFEAKHAVELRLFRYARTKTDNLAGPTASRWAALPHIENGVNPYDGSNWLGGLPATGTVDRFSRVQLQPLASGDMIDVLDLARNWLKITEVTAWASAGGMISDKTVHSSWRARPGLPSRPWGISKNIEPARFAVGYVARDDRGRWYAASSLSTFAITSMHPPFLWDPSHPDNVSPAPASGVVGRRIWVANPQHTAGRVMCRLTRSELTAGV